MKLPAGRKREGWKRRAEEYTPRVGSRDETWNVEERERGVVDDSDDEFEEFEELRRVTVGRALTEKADNVKRRTFSLQSGVKRRVALERSTNWSKNMRDQESSQMRTP